MEDKKSGQAVILNPYVSQADRFAMSLKHLGDTFLKLEGPRERFTTEEIQEMFERVSNKVCASCENKEKCMGKRRPHIYQMVYEILCAVEEYGTELNVELKRKLQKNCILAPRFLRETLEVFQEAKKMLLWSNKMVQNREGCAIQLDTFAKMIQHATRELEASIFMDPPLEKKIRTAFKKAGIRLLSTVFFVTPQGRYEIHVTAKPEKGKCISTKSMARLLSQCTSRRISPAKDERPVLSQEYCTIVCVEGPCYYTLQGIAKIGKGCQKISGDCFVMTQLPGGQEAAILSDGMGSGEAAFKESAMVVEMLEELLKAGFPKETALEMMNTALVMGREEVFFSTVDLSVFDLYTGGCEFIKAGAAQTFIRRHEKVEHIYSNSMPLGVVKSQMPKSEKTKLSPGDMVVMVTDGVLDALPPGKEEQLLDMIIGGTALENPKELAHYILEKVLELGNTEPLDDMTVLVAGIWEMCYTGEEVSISGRK